MIIEYTQAQPLDLSGSYYTLKIFVGSASFRYYFADSAGTTSTPALFFDVSNMALDFCSQVIDGTIPTTRQTTKDGYFDIMNFVWFAGPGVVYQNSTGNQTTKIVDNLKLILLEQIQHASKLRSLVQIRMRALCVHQDTIFIIEHAIQAALLAHLCIQTLALANVISLVLFI